MKDLLLDSRSNAAPNFMSKEIDEKFESLTDAKKALRIFKQSEIFGGSAIQEIKISIFKSYKDERSFSLVALYSAFFESGEHKEMVGLANSDGVKKYAWQMTKLLYEGFEGGSSLAVPRPIGYLNAYDLFLREHIPGQTMAEIIKREKGLKKRYADQIVEWLGALQKVSTVGNIKKQIDFNKLENNLAILKQRGVDVSAIEQKYIATKDKIEVWSKKHEPVFVHGDFNPFNMIIANGMLTLIDFEDAHLGGPLIDVADFISHLTTLPDLELNPQQRQSSCDIFIKSYEQKSGRISAQRQEKMDTYLTYFNLLVQTHTLVWGNSV